MADVPRIYVDAAPFIDLVKVKVGVGIPDDQQKDVWVLDRVLQAARDGLLEVFTSTLSIAECTHVDDPARLDAAKPFFMGVLASGRSGVRLIQTTLSVVERARDLRWLHQVSLKGADAVHVASALHVRCDEFFTGDGRIHRHAEALAPLGTRILKPGETRLLPAKYLQGVLFGGGT
jgi:predicted nucleic acid-binding protein